MANPRCSMFNEMATICRLSSPQHCENSKSLWKENRSLISQGGERSTELGAGEGKGGLTLEEADSLLFFVVRVTQP